MDELGRYNKIVFHINAFSRVQANHRQGVQCPTLSITLGRDHVRIKGYKGLYEWGGLKRKDELPRIVTGKYLNLLYDIHERKGTSGKGDLTKTAG